MRFAIYGTGGVGGYFGARLAQSGADVVFVARGAHLAALQADGLRVESPQGDISQRVRAAADPAELGPVDVVVLGVKAWQVADAAAAIAPLLGKDSFVLPLQNGVEAASEIAHVVGAERVIGGLCKIVSHVAAPGWIRHTGVAPRVEFGELQGGGSARVDALRAQFERCCGVSVGTPSDIRVALWSKFLFISPVSALGAVTRLSVGPVRETPQSRALLEQAAREVLAVGQAHGVALAADSVTRMMHFLDNLPRDATTSMQRDIAEGRPSELDHQIGAVSRLGRSSSTATPVSDMLHACLAPLEHLARVAP